MTENNAVGREGPSTKRIVRNPTSTSGWIVTIGIATDTLPSIAGSNTIRTPVL